MKDFPGFDASQDAEALYNAMKGFGTDTTLDCHPEATLMSTIPSVDPCMAGHPALPLPRAACLL